MAVTLEDGGHILVGGFARGFPVGDDGAAAVDVDEGVTRSSKSCGVVTPKNSMLWMLVTWSTIHPRRPRA